MPKLVACPHCQSHALTTEARCPHCGGQLRVKTGALALTAAAALLGLSPLACEKNTPEPNPPSDSGGVAEPEYGVPDTSGDPGVDDPVTDPADDPDFQAEYGVPATEEPEMAPMYGVPDSEVQ